MTKPTETLLAALAVLFLAAGAVFGWALNLAKIWQTGFDVLTGEVVVRCIGAFIVPLGAILGYIG